MAEIASEKSDEGQQVGARVGFVKEIFPNEKSNYETGVFGTVAHNVGWTEDHLEHTTIIIGFAFAKKPRDQEK